MNNVLKKYMPLILMILGGLLIIGGVLSMIFGAGDSEGLIKAVYIIFSIVMMLLGCAVIYFTTLLRGGSEPNFFLYETKTGTNMPVDELTFEHLNKKMTYFMTKIASNAREIWVKDVIGSDNEIFGDNDVFRPLAAYKALFDLTDRGNEVMWKQYINATDDIVVSIADALAISGDAELGKAFRYLHKNSGGDYERTAKFLADNKKYIQKKMLKYVKENIDKF